MCSISSGSRSALGRSPMDGSTREGRNSTTFFLRPALEVFVMGGLGGSGGDGGLVAGEDRLDLALLREALGRELGEDELVVLLHLEAASIGRDQDQGLDVLLEALEQLFRQTDGTGFVVSDRAVADLDLHGRP